MSVSKAFLSHPGIVLMQLPSLYRHLDHLVILMTALWILQFNVLILTYQTG